jgi:hypothetical protein
MKAALIMATVICITNGTAESKFESIWSADMVKTIIGGVMKRYFANCVYLLQSSYDQGEDLAVILLAEINLLYVIACVGNLTRETSCISNTIIVFLYIIHRPVLY